MKVIVTAILMLFPAACNFTPEDHQRIAAALQNAGNNISRQQAENRFYTEQANQNALNYMERQSIIQQQARQNDLYNFQQRSYQRNVESRLNDIERNTRSLRGY